MLVSRPDLMKRMEMRNYHTHLHGFRDCCISMHHAYVISYSQTVRPSKRMQKGVINKIGRPIRNKFRFVRNDKEKLEAFYVLCNATTVLEHS